MNKNVFLNNSAKKEDLGNGIEREILAYGDDLMLCRLHFIKGACGLPHKHPHSQITYIISGKFEAEINGTTAILAKGDSVYEGGNIIHGLKCLEEGIILDIFTPKREDFLVK